MPPLQGTYRLKAVSEKSRPLCGIVTFLNHENCLSVCKRRGKRSHDKFMTVCIQIITTFEGWIQVLGCMVPSPGLMTICHTDAWRRTYRQCKKSLAKGGLIKRAPHTSLLLYLMCGGVSGLLPSAPTLGSKLFLLTSVSNGPQHRRETPKLSPYVRNQWPKASEGKCQAFALRP